MYYISTTILSDNNGNPLTSVGTAERGGGVSLLVGVVSRTAGALVDAGPHARVVVCCPSSLPGGRGVDAHAPETVAGPVQQRGVGWMSCSVAARKQGGALLYRLYIYILRFICQGAFAHESHY